MEVKFVKTNPGGNTTVLILDAIPRDLYPKLASKLMLSTSLSAEQVGFIEPPIDPEALGRLEMMGGEFCGNASRGYAAWLADRWGAGGRTGLIPVEVSGHDGILRARVESDLHRKHTYDVSISMPVPRSIREGLLGHEGGPYTVVVFEGITHAVLWDQPGTEDRFYSFKRELEKELGPVDCLGVMFYDQEKRFLTPVVYVRKVDSLVWEGSCGSGSVAVAAALAQRDKRSVEGLSLVQPGGTIEVYVAWDDRIIEARIGGKVSIEAQGVAYVDL